MGLLKSGYLGKEIVSAEGILFVNITKPSIGNSQEVNQALLGEFRIQEDVEMYIR